MKELRSLAISSGLEGDCIWALLRALLSAVAKNPKLQEMDGYVSDSKGLEGEESKYKSFCYSHH